VASDEARLKALLAKLQSYSGPPVSVMEVCGTHTVAIARMGLRGLLPEGVTLLSGPGCPVCVTPVEVFDEAIFLAAEKGVVLATYGDSLRVPGSRTTLAGVRAEGARVVPVYSALDALKLAREHPGDEVVFLGIGFETTAPTVAHSVHTAAKAGVSNYSVLTAHKALIPAMEALLADPEMQIGAFLCPGHASMVIGSDAYGELCAKHNIPCVVTGFEPEDVLLGMIRILAQAQTGEASVENVYPRAVSPEGNPAAMAMLGRIYELCDSNWRGLGHMAMSGYGLKPEYAAFDARRRFLEGMSFEGKEPAGCRCAEVLRGRMAPAECPLFAKTCTPLSPVGACMVSSEGACGAHYRYRGIE